MVGNSRSCPPSNEELCNSRGHSMAVGSGACQRCSDYFHIGCNCIVAVCWPPLPDQPNMAYNAIELVVWEQFVEDNCYDCFCSCTLGSQSLGEWR